MKKYWIVLMMIWVLNMFPIVVKGWELREECTYMQDDDVLAGIDFDYVYDVGEYCILEKQIAGFDTNEIRYAIYDVNKKSVAMDFLSLPGGIQESPNFSSPEGVDYNFIDAVYNGDGMFSYSLYNDYSGSLDTIFLSADAGTYFSVDIDTSKDKIKFHNKKALFLLDDYKSGYVDGCIPPDNKLCWMTTMGEIYDYDLEGYDNQTKEGFAYFDELSVRQQWDCESFIFSDIDHNKYLLIHCFSDDKVIKVEEQSVLKRMTEDSYVSVLYQKDSSKFIEIGNILGDDGYMYSSVFDENGNMTVSPIKSETDEFYADSDYSSELLGTWNICEDDASITFREDGTICADENGDVEELTYYICKELQTINIGTLENPILLKYVIWDNYLYILQDALYVRE
ncbi:MAG: hypothetical protein SOY73_06395 [Blautia sp.]|nr:hypothetical protein [Blautia sp.]